MNKVAVKIDSNNTVTEFQFFEFADGEQEILPTGFDVSWTIEQWNIYVAGREVLQQRYTREEIEKMAIDFQNKDFNANGLVYLTQVKLSLIDNFRVNAVPKSGWLEVLPYAMVMAIETYILKIWTRYNFYRLQLLNNVLVEDIEFNVVGEPPCWRGDVEWVVSPSYQAAQPNRPVNLNLQFYKDYITQNS